MAYIDTYALQNCIALSALYSFNTTAPSVESTTFSSVPTSTCVLYVPTGSKEAYASADYWSDFTNIVEMDTPELIYNALIASLNAAQDTISNNYATVASDYTSTIASIQSAIDALYDEMMTLYNAGEFTEETIVDTSEIESAITAMLSDAKAAQAIYDDEEATKQAVIDEAYAKLVVQIDMVQGLLNIAEGVISTYYAETADDYESTISDIQEEIDELSAALLNAYEDATLTTESNIDLEVLVIAGEVIAMFADDSAEEEGEEEEETPTTELSKIAADMMSAIYNLQGQRLSSPAKGVNVINGRKVLVK